jgi:bifunctional UDP-N-acetylglucosamine pyrophosphorylase/glucosamine-1-phosphate N-acetyltransferase
LTAARPLEPEPLVLVSSRESSAALGDVPGVTVAVQERPRGTGDAVASARPAVGDGAANVLVLSGDTPLLTVDLLQMLVEEHRRSSADVTVLSFVVPDPGAYGRVLRDGDGRLAGIVEAVDATPEQLSGGVTARSTSSGRGALGRSRSPRAPHARASCT